MRVRLHRNSEFSSDFVLLCVFLANPRRRICHNINVKGGRYYQRLTTDRLPLLRRHFRVPHGNVECYIYKPLRSGKEQVDCLVNRDHKTEHKNYPLIYPVAQFSDEMLATAVSAFARSCEVRAPLPAGMQKFS